MIRRIAKRMTRRLRCKGQRINDWYRWRYGWRSLPRAEMVREVCLGDWGGCQLFVEDINNDGVPELLWLQSVGMFKSRLYQQPSGAPGKYLQSCNQDLFCLTATTQTGEILWQIGRPDAHEHPYLSHSPECMVTCADVDGDGKCEILVLDGCDGLLLLDGDSGEVKARTQLPQDNFSIVRCGRTGPNANDIAILVGVTDGGYWPHAYGNPWLFLDSSLNIVHQGDYLGAGHDVAIMDVNGDGVDEFLIGYQLVDHRGKVIWTVDEWRDRSINPQEQHVDHVETCWIEGQWFAAIAGSDRLYWVNSSGHVVWSRRLPHPQFCLIGRHSGNHSIFVLNQREVMNCFDIKGNEVWRGLLPESWPMGRPQAALGSTRPIHTNDPATLISANHEKGNDLILYKEGGWPYVVDFRGKPVCALPYTPNARRPKASPQVRRINDIGLSFEGCAHDLDGDGIPELLIHDRGHLWIYSLEGAPLQL